MRKQTEMAEYAEIISSIFFLEFPHFFCIFRIFPQRTLFDAEINGNGGIRGNCIVQILPLVSALFLHFLHFSATHSLDAETDGNGGMRGNYFIHILP